VTGEPDLERQRREVVGVRQFDQVPLGDAQSCCIARLTTPL